MIFKEPIVFDEGYRVIPNYAEWAISKDGQVIDNETGLKRPKVYVPKSDFYPSIALRLTRYNRTKSVAIHRLVALAWCNNADPINKKIPNHIDGDKKNYVCSNLEWVSHSENVKHAFQTGLRTDNLGCLLRNKDTGEIREYYSLEEMARAFGISRGRDSTYYLNGPPSRLFMAKWEVRVKGDLRPWFYEIGQEAIPRSRYRTTVRYPDETVEVYWDNRDIIKKFNCWNVSSGIKSIIEKAKTNYPELIFEVEDRWKDRIVQTFEVKTMSVVDESPWVRNAARLMGVSRGTVERLLRTRSQKLKNGYAVRYKPCIDVPWKTVCDSSVSDSVCVQVTDLCTGKKTIFSSLREIERELKVSRFITQGRILTGKPYQNLQFKVMRESESSSVETLK